jgi:uncharacterized protein (DUF1501 family)
MAEPIMVIVFLRGGADGLTLVSPSSDQNYINARAANLRVDRKGAESGFILDNPAADVDFRFHARMKPFHDLYKDKQLAVIHAAGLKNATRSHFEAEDQMERGAANGGARSGWLTRTLASLKPEGILPALAVGDAAPDSLLGHDETTVASELNDVRLAAGHGVRPAMLQRMGESLGNHVLFGQPFKQLLSVGAAIEAKSALDGDGNLIAYAPSGNANYPNNPLAQRFRVIAQSIKLGLGLRVATVDFGGWDTHVDQGGQIENLMEELSTATAAFWRDLGSHQENVTLICMSEFGRRLKNNQSGGTDHGHGNAMFVLGTGLNGGMMHGAWPGLDNEALDEGADLAITTDYRDVLADVLQARMKLPDIASIFPGYERQSLNLFA